MRVLFTQTTPTVPPLDPPVTSEELTWREKKLRARVFGVIAQTVGLSVVFGVGMLVAAPDTTTVPFKIKLALGVLSILFFTTIKLRVISLVMDVQIKRDMDNASALEREFLRELGRLSDDGLERH